MNHRSKICRKLCPQLTRKQRIDCRVNKACDNWKAEERKFIEKEWDKQDKEAYND